MKRQYERRSVPGSTAEKIESLKSSLCGSNHVTMDQGRLGEASERSFQNNEVRQRSHKTVGEAFLAVIGLSIRRTCTDLMSTCHIDPE